METYIPSLLDRLSARINLRTVIFEAVVNSIQANATEISVEVQREQHLDLSDDSIAPISGIAISDNGDGFTPENINSFSVYGSAHKREMGCKGIGRLSYLKIFESVKITSLSLHSKQKVDLVFTEHFTKNDFKASEYKGTDAKTTLMLNNFRSPRNDCSSIYEIRNSVFEHILPMLYLRRNLPAITIVFKDQTSNARIVKSDVPQFEQEVFQLSHKQGDETETTDFTLHYHIKPSGDTNLLGHYCANNRTVDTFASAGLKMNPVAKHQAIFLLESPYLNANVDDYRNELTIPAKQSDIISPFSLSDINAELEKHVEKIVFSKFPDMEKEKEEKLKEIYDEYLYLTDYLGDVSNAGGLINPSEIIDKAEKAYFKDKTEVKRALKSGKLTGSEAISKASNIAGKELIEYVQMRDKIISQLESMKTERDEFTIQNLFIKRLTTGTNFSPVPVNENNLWLIDDKFMLYNYVASETHLKTLLKNVSIEPAFDSTERADVGIYSDSENAKRVILVEFKKFTANYKENSTGITQLEHYARILSKSGITEIYLYLIAKIDDNFREDLVGGTGDFTRVFSHKGEVYQRSYSKINAYIQVISPDAIISDARARNKTFIDMLKNMSSGNNKQQK